MITLTKLAWLSLQALMADAGDGPDPAKWDVVVKSYVTAESRVEYAKLRRQGLAMLDAYLKEVAVPWPRRMNAAERKATRINAYNALTIRWIVANYPVESIHKTPDPFTSRRHIVDGQKVSLDEVEAELRAMKDPRIHAALVCAARSCPPLRREAYVAERIDAQLDDNTRTWLADSARNEFLPDRKLASVSPIFKWYLGDFGTPQELRRFLSRYAPDGKRSFLMEDGAKVDFRGDYDWGLNDASITRDVYGRWDLYWDVALHNSAYRMGGLAGVVVAISTLWILRKRFIK